MPDSFPSYNDWMNQWKQKYTNPLVQSMFNSGGNDNFMLPQYYQALNTFNAKNLANQPQTQTPASFTPYPDPTPYYSDEKLKNFFNLGRSNAFQMQEQSASGAQRAARSQAGAGNFLNPAQYSMNAGNQVRQAYSPVFGQLASQEAQALDQNSKALLAALTQKSQLEEMSRQFNVGDARQGQALQQQMIQSYLQNIMQQAQLQQQQSMSGANAFDYLGLLGSLLSLPTGGGSNLLGRIFG